MAHIIHCTKLNKQAEGLDKPPYPGEIGQRILEHISKQAWQQWLDHQVLLINENRLSLVEPEARKFLASEMQKFLFQSGSEKPTRYKKPADNKTST